MIKKLRLRFIISALFSIFLVLAATIAAINISNYVRAERDTATLLNQIVERERRSLVEKNSFDYTNGNQQGQPGWGGQTQLPDSQPPEKPDGLQFTESDPSKEDPRGQYFITVFNTKGEVEYTYFHMISVDKEADQEIAKSIYVTDKSKGRIGNYTYIRKTATDYARQQYYSGTWNATAYRMDYEKVDEQVPFTETYLAFVDTTEARQSFGNWLVTSIVIALVSYTIIAALIIVSSHFIFRTSEESYHKQKAFITNASHELKTPLTIINTDLEILRMDNGDNEWTESIADQVRRLTMMTNQLVTLSKLDEASFKNYSFTVFSISQLAKESFDAFLPSYEKQGFKVKVDIDEDVDVRANKYLINELFYIFLDNALKYTSSNGEIIFQVKKNPKNRLEMLFANDTDDQEVDVNQLFERFYRSPRNNKKDGSGIGLSIAKEIVELHKGKITTSIKDGKIYFNILF